MAQIGAAQAALGDITFHIHVIKSQFRTSFLADVDLQLYGAQIKKDMLEKHAQPPIPADMRCSPQSCNLFLCVGERRILVENSTKLTQYAETFENAALLILRSEENPDGVQLVAQDLVPNV